MAFVDQDHALILEDVLELLEYFDFREEFLLLVIEPVDGPEKQRAHFHRLNKVGLN